MIRHRIIAVEPGVIYSQIGCKGDKKLLLARIDVIAAEVIINKSPCTVTAGRDYREPNDLRTVTLEAVLSDPPVDSSGGDYP